MDLLPLFVRANLIEILLSTLAIVASIIIIHVLRKDPKNEKGFNWKILLPAALPPVVVALVILSGRVGGMTYPTGVAVHDQYIILEGIRMETRKQGGEDGIEEEYEIYKTFLYNKNTGEPIKRLDHFIPVYVNGLKLLGVHSGYHVVDLATGETVAVFNDDEIKEKAAAGEKVFSIDYSYGEPGFAIRTVRNREYTYDPITNQINPKDLRYPFMHYGRKPHFPLEKTGLFEPRCIGVSDGFVLVRSYEDLEKNNFILSCFDEKGTQLWSKFDYEIHEDLDGESFPSPRSEYSMALDGDLLYFFTENYLVCLSLSTGEVKWMNEV